MLFVILVSPYNCLCSCFSHLGVAVISRDFHIGSHCSCLANSHLYVFRYENLSPPYSLGDFCLLIYVGLPDHLFELVSIVRLKFTLETTGMATLTNSETIQIIHNSACRSIIRVKFILEDIFRKAKELPLQERSIPKEGRLWKSQRTARIESNGRYLHHHFLRHLFTSFLTCQTCGQVMFWGGGVRLEQQDGFSGILQRSHWSRVFLIAFENGSSTFPSCDWPSRIALVSRREKAEWLALICRQPLDELYFHHADLIQGFATDLFVSVLNS
jgi:hypothetical protein